MSFEEALENLEDSLAKCGVQSERASSNKRKGSVASLELAGKENDRGFFRSVLAIIYVHEDCHDDVKVESEMNSIIEGANSSGGFLLREVDGPYKTDENEGICYSQYKLMHIG